MHLEIALKTKYTCIYRHRNALQGFQLSNVGQSIANAFFVNIPTLNELEYRTVLDLGLRNMTIQYILKFKK